MSFVDVNIVGENAAVDVSFVDVNVGVSFGFLSFVDVNVYVSFGFMSFVDVNFVGETM